jgi:hypothetical protein
MFWAVTLSSANKILSDTVQHTFIGRGNQDNLLVKAYEVNGKTTSVPSEVYLLAQPKVLALMRNRGIPQKGISLRSPFLPFFLLVESCLLSVELGWAF